MKQTLSIIFALASITSMAADSYTCSLYRAGDLGNAKLAQLNLQLKPQQYEAKNCLNLEEQKLLVQKLRLRKLDQTLSRLKENNSELISGGYDQPLVINDNLKKNELQAATEMANQIINIQFNAIDELRELEASAIELCISKRGTDDALVYVASNTSGSNWAARRILQRFSIVDDGGTYKGYISFDKKMTMGQGEKLEMNEEEAHFQMVCRAE